MDSMTLKEQIAEKIFPFELYFSGEFNHADLIEAMIKMAEIFESFYGQALIDYYDIKKVEHQLCEMNANEIVDNLPANLK